MDEQPDLFDVGERDIHGEQLRDSQGRLRIPRRLCIPAQIGTGPAGETCRTCRHLYRKRMGNTYLKCGLMEKYHSNGAATDIRAGWAACARWEAKEE
jgi:hypothetical protein